MLLAAERSRLPARDVDHRLRAVHPGSAGAPARAAGQGRCPAPPVLERRCARADAATELSKGKARCFDRLSTHGAQADGSDFLALLRLWDYLREQQKALSGNAFRRMCRDEFLHFLRVREWQDLHAQLKQICRELGLHRNEAPAPPDRVHTAALAGLLSHVGLADLVATTRSGRGRPTVSARKQRRTAREYLGARGTRFAINPGSSLARDPAAAGDGGRDRRDHPAVGADGRPDHRRAGRGGRRAPAEAATTPSRTGRPAPAR